MPKPKKSAKPEKAPAVEEGPDQPGEGEKAPTGVDREIEEEAEQAAGEVGAEEPAEEVEEEPRPAEEAEPVPEEIEVVEERIIPVDLSRVWNTPRTRRAPKAIRVVRAAVKRHMKVSDVKITNEVNERVWLRGIEKPPRKIAVRAVKDKEGNVIVFPSK
ncbi:MAG: 50S ribosomal protein L31e [Candidatus Bathyarchaeia archaeon]